MACSRIWVCRVKSKPLNRLRREQEPLAKLLERFGNLVERDAERLDVLTFEGRDKGLRQLGADLLGDALVLFAQQREIIQGAQAFAGTPQGSREQIDAFAGLGGRFFEQVEEPFVPAQESLQGEHGCRLSDRNGFGVKKRRRGISDSIRPIGRERSRAEIPRRRSACADPNVTASSGPSAFTVGPRGSHRRRG